MAKVLIVDDVKALREMLGAAVKSMSHEPTLCASSSEATKALNGAIHFELILLDIELEDGDGISLMKLIKSIRETRKIPMRVCFISGSRDKETIVRAISEGGDDYILKPIDPKIFKEKVSTLLQTNSKTDLNFLLDVKLKANLFESSTPTRFVVTKISSKEVYFKSEQVLEIGKTYDLAIPTLGNHLGYKGTFRGSISSYVKEKDGTYSNVFALQDISSLGIESKLKAFCTKGVFISDFESDVNLAQIEKKQKPAAASTGKIAPPVNSAAMAALASFKKKTS